jgi:hypothetical protein
MRLSSVQTLLVASHLLVGCSTLPTVSDTTPVPTDRMRTPFASPTQESAKLVLLRDTSAAGGMVAYVIIVNGTEAARIRTGERAELYVPQGDTLIEIRHPSVHFGAAGDSATLTAKPGMAYFFRINSDLGQIKLLRTSESSANALTQ